MSDKNRRNSLSYKDAGVDIDAGNKLVERIKGVSRRTTRPEVLGGLGGFGALCEIPAGYRHPVLVSGTDGVGTKLRLAMDMGIHDTIGIDLVAMCVNDLVVAGAEPLFFLDYYATGTLNVDTAAAVVTGIGAGCELAGCALVGGETAEMPGMYEGEDYDLAGFCVGVVEKSDIIDGSGVADGDVLLGVASSGPHSNGYSLIRKILEVSAADLQQPLGQSTLGQALLAPTTIYVKALLELFSRVQVKALSHITGGGLLENLPRVLPTSCKAQIDTSSWDWPEVFRWLQQQGNVDTREMYRTFNCGVGMVLCIAPEDRDEAVTHLAAAGHKAWQIGQITAGEHEVELLVVTARLAVLISGRGTNLQAFIDACANGSLAAQISVVLSNNPDAPGLRRAAQAGIPTRCINHRDYDNRESFDRALAAELDDWQVDLVILAGFMRILTPAFISPFGGRLLNVHPSLLPKYPGLNTHQRALDAGDPEAGVTVHFVTLELDGGPPIIQARVPVRPTDTADSLAERVIVAEHLIYPLAAQWYITGRLQLTDRGAYLDGKPIPATGIDYPQASN